MNTNMLTKLFEIENFKRISTYSKIIQKQIIIITILNVTSSILSIILAFSTKQFVDNAFNDGGKLAILYLLLFITVIILDLLTNSCITYLTTRNTEKLRNKLHKDFIVMIFNKSWLDVTSFSTGDLMSRIYSDVNNIVAAVVTTLPKIIALFVQLVLAFTFLASYDLTLAVLTFLITPITLIVGLIIGKYIKSIQTSIQNLESKKKSIITETLQNQLIIKSFNYENNIINKMDETQSKLDLLILNKSIFSIKSNLVVNGGFRFGFAASIIAGAYKLSIDRITAGTFTALIQLVGQIQGPIQGLSQSLPQLIASFSSLERLETITQLDNESYNTAFNVQLNNVERMIIKNLSFSYGQVPILKDLNLSVRKGEKITIVGESGQGKTTLLNILMSLLKTNAGEIYFETDNHNMFTIDAQTRYLFSYVPQSNSLVSGTLRENLFLKGDELEADITKALNAACCDNFVGKLELGIDSNIGERGIGLSQGQGQRIAIARALIHKAPFLLFDEATSALDDGTELCLINNLKMMYPDISLIAVTHRSNLFSICDKVYRLEGGRLIDEIPI